MRLIDADAFLERMSHTDLSGVKPLFFVAENKVHNLSKKNMNKTAIFCSNYLLSTKPKGFKKGDRARCRSTL